MRETQRELCVVNEDLAAKNEYLRMSCGGLVDHLKGRVT